MQYYITASLVSADNDSLALSFLTAVIIVSCTLVREIAFQKVCDRSAEMASLPVPLYRAPFLRYCHLYMQQKPRNLPTSSRFSSGCLTDAITTLATASSKHHAGLHRYTDERILSIDNLALDFYRATPC